MIEERDGRFMAQADEYGEEIYAVAVRMQLDIEVAITGLVVQLAAAICAVGMSRGNTDQYAEDTLELLRGRIAEGKRKIRGMAN